LIEFAPTIQNPKLFRKTVRWATNNKDHIPSLSNLAPKLTVAELTDLARSWQKIGFGQMIEASEEGRRSVFFSLNQDALSASEELDRRGLKARLSRVPRSDWIALAALAVSALSAYFTYLTVRSQ
jgi:hypothetical protein